MRLITYSLWGQNPKYLIGALRNAELAKTIYPEWICRFYVGACVPLPIIFQLEDMDNVEVVRKPTIGDWRGMFWRFEPASEDNVEVMISRDTDSRLTVREKAAVLEWIDSDRGFHIMRDHPYHKFPVLGGMWGVKKGILPQMKDLINSFSQQDQYGTDYKFFAEKILPIISEDALVHDEFFGGLSFPLPRINDWEFVGQVYDENEITPIEHIDALRKYYENR